jgi:protein-tyrosine phosphatase
MEITFEINYRCLFGQSVCVLGNIPALGGWDVSKAFPLIWNEGDNWKGQVLIDDMDNKQLEYKYLVMGGGLESKCEAGRPRIMDLGSCQQEKRLMFNDVWEYRQIELRAFNTFKSHEFLYILTNIDNGFKTKGAVPMKLILDTTSNQPYWTIEFKVHYTQQSFHYKYLLYNQKTRQFICERKGKRQFHQDSSKISNEIRRNRTISIKPYKGGYIKLDCNLQFDFSFVKVQPHLSVGPYPSSLDDIRKLQSYNVKAVLNLQTDRDMKTRGVDWEKLKGDYKSMGIAAVNIPIVDMDWIDLQEKADYATQVLHRLIKQYETVFVHCTAGINRSPHVVLKYMCEYEKHDMMEAQSLLKKARRRSIPHNDTTRLPLFIGSGDEYQTPKIDSKRTRTMSSPKSCAVL